MVVYSRGTLPRTADGISLSVYNQVICMCVYVCVRVQVRGWEVMERTNEQLAFVFRSICIFLMAIPT